MRLEVDRAAERGRERTGSVKRHKELNEDGRETETEVKSPKQRQREVRCQEQRDKSSERKTVGIIMKKLGTDRLEGGGRGMRRNCSAFTGLRV